MKRIIEITKIKGYTLAFRDKSGNWIGGYRKGGYIIIRGPGFDKAFYSLKDVRNFLVV